MNPTRRSPKPLLATTPSVAWLSCLVVTMACATAAAQDRPRGEVDGVVIAGYDATLAFPLGGVLLELNAEPGARVSAGSPLAKLDDADARANAELARLAAEDTTGVELAEQRLEIARLNDGGARNGPAAAVRAEDQRAKANLRIAELELQRQQSLHQQAQRRHDAALARLRQHTLTAPVDAVVEQVHLSPGSFVAAGKPIVRLVQPRKLLVEVQAPSDLAAGLSLRGRVNVYPIAGDAAPPIPGRIVFIAATLNPETDSRLVRITLDGEPDLLPGARVGVDLTPTPAPKPDPERSEGSGSNSPPQP